MSETFHAPIAFDRVLDDPGLVRRLVEANAPFHPVQRYFTNAAQYRALARGGGDTMIVAPNFRGDWAYDRPLVDGVEPILHHEGFTEAARTLFDAELVEPFCVYVNITHQLPFDQGPGHTDVPEFCGIDRTEYATPLLTVMGHSRLFEAERVQIATAVAWYYDGVDGGFMYWPDGPDAPPQVHEGDIANTALIADNERMFHRVRPVGDRSLGLPSGLTLDSTLVHRGGDAWAIVESGEDVATPDWSDLRISLSWKARVYVDDAARRRHRDHEADLTIDEVFRRFYSDLDRRGVEYARPADPVEDPDLIEILADTYVRTPSVFEPVAA